MHDRLNKTGQDAETIDTLLTANPVRSMAITTGTAVLCWSVAFACRP